MGDAGRAEDVAQESFISWAALPGFKGESKFSSWLYRICYNTCISELRKRRPEVELDEAMAIPVEGPVQEFHNRNIQAAIQEEVSKLPDDYRAALTLYHFNGLSYEEIAKLTHRPMGTVKAHIHRARAALKTGHNFLRWGNPEVDKLLAQGIAVTKQDERQKIYFEIQRIIAEFHY
jgi:RNA polymerase sigma-70 factor (ECF subfamily)